jgi:GNAT superfamily N-acetyltransferase
MLPALRCDATRRQCEEVPPVELCQDGARHPAGDLVRDIGGVGLPVPLLIADLGEVACLSFDSDGETAPKLNPVEAHAVGAGVDSGRLMDHALILREYDLAHADVLVNMDQMMRRGYAMDQVHIRACTLGDIDAVIGLERQWEREEIAYGNFNPLSHEAYVSILERFGAYFLVAESDGQLVGYIHASVQRNNPVEVIPAQEPYVEIEDIYVQPDYRGRDIGGALLEGVFEVARQEGIQRFVVGTLSKETDRILAFYRSHGFTPWRIQFFK